jgi:hypothetical protein
MSQTDGGGYTVHSLTALQREEVRAVMKVADVIYGHDEAQGGKPVLFFGREALERIATAGREEFLSVFRVSYDSRTTQLEYLAAAVEVLKGSCCYQPSGPQPKVLEFQFSDGSIETHTTDADPYFAEDRARGDVELQAALDAYHADGVPRPVLFTCTGRDGKTAQLWRQLEPELKAAGKVIFNANDQWLPCYLVATDAARRVLLPICGKAAARQFRAPSFPLGYWTVNIDSQRHEFYESRTFKDMGSDSLP